LTRPLWPPPITITSYFEPLEPAIFTLKLEIARIVAGAVQMELRSCHETAAIAA
jgi:hypothetical protein